MKHLLIALLFYGMPGRAQFMPGTDFYNRHREFSDSINKSRTIFFMRNDSVFGRIIFPHGNPIINDTVDTYRTNITYKINKVDSGIVYATPFSRNKARDSVQANIPTNNTQLSNGSGFITSATIPKLYDKSGLIAGTLKIFTDTISATSATQTISISTAGFTKIYSVQVQTESNTATVANIPIAVIKSWTNSAVIVNLLASSTVALNLGIITAGLNLSGLQLASSFTGVKLHVTIIGI